MASIVRFKDKWRAHVFFSGRRESRVFRTRAQAKVWAWRRQHDLQCSHWTPPFIELLPLSDLRLLPRVIPTEPVSGVYFLWDSDRLVYIGQSKNVAKRVATHKVRPPAKFGMATYLSIPYPWQLAVEALYIETYLPQLAAEEPGILA